MTLISSAKSLCLDQHAWNLGSTTTIASQQRDTNLPPRLRPNFSISDNIDKTLNELDAYDPTELITKVRYYVNYINICFKCFVSKKVS